MSEFKCDICDKVYSSNKVLANYKIIKYNVFANEGNRKCSVGGCKQLIACITFLIEHLQASHQLDESPRGQRGHPRLPARAGATQRAAGVDQTPRPWTVC